MALNYHSKCQWKHLWVYLLVVLHFIPSTNEQRNFPKLEFLSALKPITSSSTCGATSSKYCESSSMPSSLTTCNEETCKFDCCSNCGSAKPSSTNIAQAATLDNVQQDGESRPGSGERSYRFSGNSYILPQRLPSIKDYVNKGFTISVWIKQAAGNKGTIISKDETTGNFVKVFQLVVEDYNIEFRYRPVGGNSSSVSVTLLQSQSENLKPNEWHFIMVSVIDIGLSYYIDGELMNTNNATLSGPILDNGGRVTIGQGYDRADQYQGLMQDIGMYIQALSNREATEAFTGNLPSVYVASHCRCPPTHPKINEGEPAKCLKNTDVGGGGTVSRLQDTAHPIEYATDNDLLSFWLSEITDNATIEINLSVGGLQVFYIIMTFYGPFPGAVAIERSIDGGISFQPWQYFADDCMASFALTPNGQLTEPDSVNCRQYEKPLEPNHQSLNFQTEYPPPQGSNIPVRPFGPGCTNLYCSDRLLQFLKATHIKFHFYNHTLVQDPQHRYYGLYKILVAGRCECFGHANTSSYVQGNSTHLGKCLCDCWPSTNTEGDHCDRCQPLYNNKPFRRGDSQDSYPCVKCECNDHADSCVYNRTLDDQPNVRDAGGGGMCVDCKHNTTGRFCQICKDEFFRESGKSLKSPDVCTHCGCSGAGVQPGKVDCVKDDSDSNVLAGQCECKTNTTGRRCDVCKAGFFDLKASHASGCVPCNCVLDGTTNRNASCHATSGQCDCKDRVSGDKCDTCKPGFWGLSGLQPLGCQVCGCDPFGTTVGNVNQCDADSGQCSCKPGAIGRRCDSCSDGFHTLTQDGCKACNCSTAGTLPSFLDNCNKSSGDCKCKLNVQGINCDSCKPGYYNLSQSNPQGCSQCACDTKGTVGGSGQCELQSGNCTCKSLVIGQTCNQCKQGTYGLNQSLPEGCKRCNCFPKGTVDGDKKNPGELHCSSNGQCTCLSSVSGLRCDSCVAEYYWNPTGQGCIQCRCNAVGSLAQTCNVTGQCSCKANVGGRQCDQCNDGFFGFGSCLPCNCSDAGSLDNKCDGSGKCACKSNVEGLKCDTCKNGTFHLQPNNKFGCSGAPSEQPAPFVTVLSSRAIMLTWSPPDNPNGIIERYELFRNGTRVYSGTVQEFNDTALSPNTAYTYYIITYAASGQTRSLEDNKVYYTFADAPEGVLPPNITNILPRNATATWSRPTKPNGRITVYRLISTSDRSPVEVVQCSGIILSCGLSDLKPYTVYNFTVEVCTNGGCSRSTVKTILTLPTLPDFQPAPNVTSLPGGKAVIVEWDEPPEPNGRIFLYELYMREAPFVGFGSLKYSSNPAHDPNPSNFRKANVTGLAPFTEYEFRVRTYTAQVQGDRASDWARHRTGEGIPLGEDAMNPSASPLNSSAVMVTWSPPRTPQGVISHYEIYKYQPPSNPTAVRASVVSGTERQGEVGALEPYRDYKFTVRACNSFDCSGHSVGVTARTEPAAPKNQGPPSVLSVNSSTVRLAWPHPLTPNGPLPPSYNVSRAFAAFYFPSPIVTAGVHFPGRGFYKFPSDVVPAGAINNIEFAFRTQHAFGLMLFLADGTQVDMLAVELRDGKPWLIFDCQEGAAAFTISESVRFDDGKWHRLKVERVRTQGTLFVDSYTASQSSVGAATVISANTGVYVGGLPDSFNILRKDVGDSKIERWSFIGCLTGFTSEGKELVWNSALEAVGVEPERNGCPARDNKKAIFLRGGGYAAYNLQSEMFFSDIFSFNLYFRTQLSSGLLFFARGPTSTIAIQFAQNRVEFKVSTSSMQASNIVSSPTDLCDGAWHNLTITNLNGLAIVLDQITNPFAAISGLQITSNIYIGGVPWGSPEETVARQFGLDVESGFGGCIKVLNTGAEIDYVRTVTALWNADLDGCVPESTVPVSSQLGSCLPFNNSVVYSGKIERFSDTTVETFTDYLYRVESYHVGTAGSAESAWVATRSGQGAPTGLQAPTQLIPLLGGRTVRVTWEPPRRPNGVLTQYRILAYLTSHPLEAPVETIVTDTTVLNYTASALIPFTTYDIKIQAFTVGGSGEGPGANVTTMESVPEGVAIPSAVRRPRELEVFWSEPTLPNGIITRYNLTVDGTVVYSGTNRNVTVPNLEVYTEYTLQLLACTRLGCAQGSQVRITTGELPPEGVSPPVVRVLGRFKVEVEWKTPNVPNGAIVRYEVLFATVDVLSAYVSKFNATPAVFSTEIGNLTAGTLYYVRVRPFTGGGGTFSNAAQGRTLEHIPDDVPAPRVIALSPYQLFVIMLAPEKPNGNITRYELYKESRLVLNVTQLTNYTAGNFTPYSRHTFRVRACTIKGCAFGEEAVAYTQEIAPNGTVQLTGAVVNATAAQVRWTPVAVPNGRVFYNLMVRGVFLKVGSSEFETEERTELAISSEEADRDFIYNGLLPFNNYTLWVNASNSKGFILSNNITDSTPEGVPGGLKAPNVTVLNSTAVQITWKAPALPNGIVLGYELHQKTGAGQSTLFRGLGFSLTVTNLMPFTVYEYRVSANTSAGPGYSQWTRVQTFEDVPGSLDAPRPVAASSVAILLDWDPPVPLNGKLLYYIIYQNDTYLRNVTGNITQYNVTGLLPFTVYVFRLSACNAIGCSNSSNSRPRTTSQSGPEGLAAPTLTWREQGNVSRAVIIEWNLPTEPNGIIQHYQIQRRKLGDANPAVISTINASLPRRYEDMAARPVTAYEYRVVGVNNAGPGQPSPYSNITTGEGDPEQIPSPTVRVLSPYAIFVQWRAPAVPNGVVTRYIVQVKDQHNTSSSTVSAATFQLNVTSLQPYVQYNVTVVACTGGGCGSSPVTQIRTFPAKPDGQPAPIAEVDTATSLLVRWDSPEGANGVIVGYVLFRRTVEEPVSDNFTGPTEYVQVFESIQREYVDVGLGIYSLQQYKVTVKTTEGNDTSDPSLPYRTGPAPPLSGPSVNATALNHSSVLVMWSPPEIKQLRGAVQTYTVDVEETSHPSRPVSRVGPYPGNQTRVTVTGLKPNTVYTFYVELFNGAGSSKSQGFPTRTLDGSPEGFGAPDLFTMSSTEIRVSWRAPLNPNGRIVAYRIYVNDTIWTNTSGAASQVILTGLTPYSYYIIKVAVCTTYSCTMSDPRAASTNPGAPAGLAAPRLTAGATFMLVEWVPPSHPNGIMVGFKLYRRMVYPCPTSPPPRSKCTFIECSLSEELCGVTCYNPANQTCCSGVLHARDPRMSCCGTSYVQKNDASDVCCGNSFHVQRPEFQCCHGNYIRVSSGRVCCQTAQGGGVVGLGNSCCGNDPFNENDPSKVCVCGTLYDPSPPRKCCGGKVVSPVQVCCGDDVSGEAYDQESGKTCCGTQYAPAETSLCCQGSAGDVVVYNYTSAADKAASNHTCCGTERVASGLSCCNERGYDPSSQTCADKSSNGTLDCGTGVVCNNSDARVALCDRCDFDDTALNCGFVRGYYAPTPATAVPRICATEYLEVLGNQYDPDLRTLNDTGLAPHTLYNYYLVAINNAGNVTSPEAENRTLMGRPEGQEPPVAVAISSSSVRVTWKEPSQHNGVIQQYRLTQINGQTGQRQVIYTGLNLTFTDRGLEPFTGYRYVIESCTTECASAEMTSLIYTDQAAPAYVNATILRPLNFSAINVSWIQPPKPNGEIIRYNVSRVVNGTLKIHLNPNDKGLDMSLVVSGLEPYTGYTFEVVACTRVGCTASPLASTLTLQAAPEGVHAPNLTVTGAKEIEAKWTEPDILNGVIIKYSLYRGAVLVYNGTDACYKNSDGKDTCLFKDTGLESVTSYNYSVAATTGGGTNRSGATTATTPESSPEGIPKANLTVRGPYSIFVEWDAPRTPNGAIINYSVVVNESEHDAGLNMSKLLGDLRPFTVYSVRIKVCTAKGCGLGDRQYNRTDQAAPIGQGPPSLVAREWDVVQISWTPPTSPNGIITEYAVYRRVGNVGRIQVCRVLSPGLTCLNSGLMGYTQYSFSVRARNIAGYVDGPWEDVRTPEGPPKGIAEPSLDVLNSTAVQVSWSAPSQPNGNVTHYEVRYREELQVPDNNNVTVAARVASNVFNVTVNGLRPFTDYQFFIAAINRRREGLSPGAITKTKQAPPDQLRPLQADKASDGKSMRIFWDEPGAPNGLITHYKLYKDGVQIYRGSTREYTVRRLVPFTSYEFELEACNVAGCTRGPVELIFSAEVSPQGQAQPTVGFVNETVVILNWKPPVVPNGVIIRYEVYRTVTPLQKRRRRVVTLPEMIYSTNKTNQTDFQYTDTGLKPYTRYGYSIRAVNSGGYSDSDQVMVTTKQAPPTAVAAPVVMVIDANSLNVTWRKPTEPNGEIQYYLANRNGSVKYSGKMLGFVDQGLEPYTVYSYTVNVCTGGGCTRSPPSSRQTAQAAPEGVHPPVLEPLGASTIRISWRVPDKPNGIITDYRVFELGSSTPLNADGMLMTVTVSNKLPYTKYSFYVSACTHVGCTASDPAEVRTKEAAPRDLDAPLATVAGSSIVRVEWKVPRTPNGLILYYLLTRNGTQVYNGTDLRFSDHTVAPFTVYAYVVTAVNSADRLSSPPGFSRPTNPGAPDNVSVPALEVLSALSIKVSWEAPGRPNGVITKYIVIYNYRGAQGNPQSRDAGVARELTIQGLQPYTLYDVRIQACTQKGCSVGEANSDRTHEAPPEGQTSPDFPTLHIQARRVLVQWNAPQKPNGFMRLYRLYRRKTFLSQNQVPLYGPEVSVVNVTNGSALEFNDTGVQPYSRYEYRVFSENSAGQAVSDWSVVQTLSAAPEQLKAPDVIAIYSHKLDVRIVPPDAPNGEIRDYVLEVSGRNVSHGINTARNVSGLEPYTEYTLRVYVCTDGGCAMGPAVTRRTTEGVPALFSAPRPEEINETEIIIVWDEPRKPNGQILRYEVLYNKWCSIGCPTAIPVNRTVVSLQRRFTATDLTPYTMYKFQIRVFNSQYSTLSEELLVQTLASLPKTTGIKPRVNVSGLRVAVNWSECFELNGPLDTYQLLENGLLTYEGQQNKKDLGARKIGEYTYVAKASTTVRGEKITVTSPASATVQVDTEAVSPTSAARTSSDEWYSSAWFIAVMSLLAIILIFLLIACCLWRTSGGRTVYVREREPLPPRSKSRSRPPSMTSLYTSSDRKNGSMIDLVPMQTPYHSSTTALFDSSERLHRTDQYDAQNGSLRKVPLDETPTWDAYHNSYSNRDSGLYDDEKEDLSDSEDGSRYGTLKKEQYFTDTHL